MILGACAHRRAGGTFRMVTRAHGMKKDLFSDRPRFEAYLPPPD